MLRKYTAFYTFGVLALVGFVACGSGDEDDGGSGAGGGGASAGAAGTGGAAGAAGMAGQAGEAGGGSGGGSGGTAGAGGEAGSAGTGGNAGQGGSAGGSSAASCAALEINLHDAADWFFTLADMTEHETEPAAWDFKMGKTGQGPWITLGDGVEAINLGNADAFVDVTEAPASGYDADPDLIGDTWKDAGAGETGFVMSNNVYVLKLADGTHAKLAVTSAKAGLITFDAFHQGSGVDLTCAMP